jgi:hypothetical protein
MPLRPEYTLHHSSLGTFLYAPLLDDRNGTSLSVLSVLARLDLDPWAEAARLSALPRASAAAAFAASLSRLPIEIRGASDTAALAARAVELLPADDPGARGGEARDAAAGGLGLWSVVALLLALLVAVLGMLGGTSLP